MEAGTVRLHVLVVEDNPYDAELVVKELEKGGFEPEWRRVETEGEYLEALDSYVDLILADYTLPSFSAPRALDLLMSRGLDLPFIIVTGTVGEEPVLECLRKGADDYLIKDRLGRLPMAVRAALASRALRAQRQLADDRARLQARLLDAVDQAVTATNLNGTITYWNVAAEKMYGWSSEEALGRHVLDATGAQVGPAEADEMLSRMSNGQSWFGDIKAQRKDGTDFLANVSLSPIRDVSGHVIGATAVSSDVTEQREAQAALQESEERLRMITDHLLDLVSQVTLEGKFLYISPSHEKVLGFTPKELVGTMAIELVHPDDRVSVLSRIRSVVRGDTAERISVRCRRSDGGYTHLEVAGQLLLDESGQPVGAVLSARETSDQATELPAAQTSTS